MLCLVIDNWETADGWCIDVNRQEAGRRDNETQSMLTEEECFKKFCEASSEYKGCTLTRDTVTYQCIPYTGDIVTGNGVAGYKCHYRAGAQMNFRGF